MSKAKLNAEDGGRPQARRRQRAKGFPWRSGAVINSERPLGQAVPGRPWKDAPVILQRRRRGGAQVSGDVACFHAALELNARAVCAYAEAARYETLPPEVEDALGRLPELSDRRHGTAIRLLTNYKSPHMHGRAVAEMVARNVGAKRHAAVLALLLRIRRALDKGVRDATVAHVQTARFVRDSVDNDRRPSEAVLLRTFLGPSLAGCGDVSARKTGTAPSRRTALRETSDVTVGELALMAFYAQVNPTTIYADYLYLGDLLNLAIHAGAHAVGFSDPLEAADAATYRCMLCGVGQDPETDPRLRRERADLAAALRQVWVQVSGLAEATRRYGTLAATL